jgi:glycosyltransferase involved in cell wall biosynthesis
MAGDKRRVLVLAHPFPPAGGAGVQRTSKLVKYLPRAGWQPTVLTTQAELYPRLFGLEDRRLLEDLPREAKVVRVPSYEGRRIPKRLAYVHARYAFPDRSRIWNLGAAPAAVLLHLRERFEVIYATGNPFSTFLLARLLGKSLRIPYVIDFRDSWVLRASGERKPYPDEREARVSAMEAEVVRDAAAVLFATRPMEVDYVSFYPELEGRTATILNGFDLSDYPSRSNPTRVRTESDPITFVYTGTFPWYLKPENLFEAFHRARQRHPGFKARARLQLFGKLEDPKRGPLKGLLEERQIAEVTEVRGYVDHPTAVHEQRLADVLVLLISSDRAQGGKAAEYLASGRPILALVPNPSPSYDVVSRSNHWAHALPDDIEGAVRAMIELFDAADSRRVREKLHAPGPELYDMSREATAARTASVFSRVTGSDRKG